VTFVTVVCPRYKPAPQTRCFSSSSTATTFSNTQKACPKSIRVYQPATTSFRNLQPSLQLTTSKRQPTPKKRPIICHFRIAGAYGVPSIHQRRHSLQNEPRISRFRGKCPKSRKTHQFSTKTTRNHSFWNVDDDWDQGDDGRTTITMHGAQDASQPLDAAKVRAFF
jgi:hypothetical protein